jgi:hypothetical protein
METKISKRKKIRSRGNKAGKRFKINPEKGAGSFHGYPQSENINSRDIEEKKLKQANPPETKVPSEKKRPLLQKKEITLDFLVFEMDEGESEW